MVTLVCHISLDHGAVDIQVLPNGLALITSVSTLRIYDWFDIGYYYYCL